MKKLIYLFLLIFILSSTASAQDELIRVFGTAEPPCPEGAAYIPPGFLSNPSPLATGCVWKEIPFYLRQENPLFCFANETLEVFEVWAECNPYDTPGCEANCRDLEIIDGIATSPPSLAGAGVNLRGNELFGPIQDFSTNQRVINQVIMSCGLEGEFHFAQRLPTPTPTPAPPPKPDDLGCNVVKDFTDGPGAALWKPVSDNTRRPVFLLPDEYWTGEMGVGSGDVRGVDGGVVAGITRRTCCPNGGRAHFDVTVPASVLDQFNPLTVRLFLGNGMVECRKVPVASQRFD